MCGIWQVWYLHVNSHYLNGVNYVNSDINCSCGDATYSVPVYSSVNAKKRELF